VESGDTNCSRATIVVSCFICNFAVFVFAIKPDNNYTTRSTHIIYSSKFFLSRAMKNSGVLVWPLFGATAPLWRQLCAVAPACWCRYSALFDWNNNNNMTVLNYP
jgi:hypothetical protein